MIQIGELCTGCAACLPVCPVSVLSVKKTRAVVSEGCIDCGLCIPSCPINVIEVMPEKKEAVKEKTEPPVLKAEESQPINTEKETEGVELDASKQTDPRV
jgi:ferredoxin